MKKILTMVAVLVLFAIYAIPVFAKGPSAPSGKSDTGHLYLVEKNPSDWSIVNDGSWGKLNYQSSKFIFNGHMLNVSEDYTLINYARVGSEWPAHIVCLGSAMSDEYGDVHIMGNWDKTNFGHDTTDGTGNPDKYKFWLVPSVDVNCPGGILPKWNPSNYLFEEVPVTFSV